MSTAKRHVALLEICIGEVLTLPVTFMDYNAFARLVFFREILVIVLAVTFGALDIRFTTTITIILAPVFVARE